MNHFLYTSDEYGDSFMFTHEEAFEILGKSIKNALKQLSLLKSGELQYIKVPDGKWTLYKYTKTLVGRE